MMGRSKQSKGDDKAKKVSSSPWAQLKEEQKQPKLAKPVQNPQGTFETARGASALQNNDQSEEVYDVHDNEGPVVHGAASETQSELDKLSRESIDSTDQHEQGISPSLTKEFDAQVRPYIDLIDNLRAYGLDRDVGLPAVAVIGDQSSGKSSTLEAICGIQLPRGSGIVTRCPLELRMKCQREKYLNWGGKISYKDKHGNKQSKDIDTSESVEEAVKEAQDAMTEGEVGISEELITLEVTSPNVPDLTLIDLPGIARVAVEGQPADIGRQIKKLIKHYIQKQETIILVVIPSNVDIATTEALQLSQEFDPDGKRSLGVLTKPDLIDKGAEAQVLKAVNNQVIPLRKGYTMVKCRGQAAVDEKQTLKEAIQDEKDFFENHDKFRVLPQDQRGIPSLAKRLTVELVEQIKNVVPDLKTDVRKKLEDTREELRNLGDGLPLTEEGRQGVLLDIVSRFKDELKGLAKGEYTTNLGQELRLLTEVRRRFDTFGTAVEGMAPSEDDRYLMIDIKKQVANHRGRELPNFIMYPVFEALVRKVIRNMKDPGELCLKDVDRSIDIVLDKLCNKWFSRFPQIMGDVKTIVSALRVAAKATCETKLDEQFDMEDLIYTQDKTYLREIDILKEKHKKDEKKRSYMSQEYGKEDKEQQEAEHILDALNCYFTVCYRRVIDMVPMIIRHQMLGVLVNRIGIELTKFAANLANANHVVEDLGVMQKRAELRDRKNRLLRAETDLSRF
ncbi:interferon-induced GTP-binding protein Mx-like isoform X2 [Liolophura sinensis]|uniref:interferon-induced GTP-binding protein Mx-like isoform X2 n=1 Tax=Liolophura sinensis TaxID=3198878 RepID=UPI0031591F71